MQKIYACPQQGRTLLLTLVMLLLTPLSMLTFGQSPCSLPVVREATNAKSTNTDIADDLAVVMSNLLSDSSQAAWLLQSGATFTENVDGTARFQGIVKQSGDYSGSIRLLALDILLSGKSFAPDANGPYNPTGVPTSGWYYYTSLMGSLTGLGELDGGQLNLALHLAPFQIGIGANQSVNAEDQVANGAHGSFEWVIVSQPTSGLQFTDYVQRTTVSDVTILLSGTPSVPCTPTINICANDIEAPIFQNCPSDINLTTISTCAAATWAEPTATDNCGTPSVSSDYNSGFCFPIGATTVTYSAIDAKGNGATCSFSVNVTDVSDPCTHDIIGPVFTTGCPTSIIADVTNLTTSCFPTTWTEPMATDNCSTPTITSNYSSGYCFPVGLTVVTYTAADATGNTTRCSFAVILTMNSSCAVSGNIIAKSCANNAPVLTGSSLPGYEYMWLQSTTGCPTQASQAIAGATAQNYSLPDRVTTTTYFARFARRTGCLVWSASNQSNCITVNANECAPPIVVSCPPLSPNTISKSCANNLPVLTGSDLLNHEYIWFMSTTGCPTRADQIVAGATGANYTLPSRPTVTTYFMRCARPIGCMMWAATNESNCITVDVDECAPPPIDCNAVSDNTITKSCVNNLPVITGTDLGNFEYVWLKISATSCTNSTPTSQVIVGATGKDYLLPSRLTQTTSFIRRARPVGCTTWGTINQSNKITINANECAPTNVCAVSGNTISKSCSNNLPVVTGAALVHYEYIWLKSTTSCPTLLSQAIAGATGQNYALSSSATVTTYFVRLARPIGCTTWATVNRSNCITITSADCPPPCTPTFSSTKSYRLVCKKSSKVVNVSGGGLTNGCPITQCSYRGTSNEQWRIFPLATGDCKIMARNSSKYLSCQQTCSGGTVSQNDYCSDGYKDWKIECVGNTGQYRCVHRASGKALCVAGGSTVEGAQMQTCTWTGGDDQLFSIEEVPAALCSVSASVLVMTATAQADRVRLTWMTNTGYDNDFYTVEKMNPSTGEFEKLALVNNTQFDDQVQSLLAFDAQPTEGDNFYRVKVSLNNGTDKLTEVKQVTFKRMLGFGAFPNPATDELYINLAEYTDKAVDIVLYNTFGKVMSRKHIDKVANTTEQLNVADFATGQYLIRVSALGKRDATQQVMIQK